MKTRNNNLILPPALIAGLGLAQASRLTAQTLPGPGSALSFNGADQHVQVPNFFSYTPPVSLVGIWQHFALEASQSGNFMRIYRSGIPEAEQAGALYGWQFFRKREVSWRASAPGRDGQGRTR